MNDAPLMRAALTLARRGLGTVWPNPAVGCVIVKDGDVVGRGWTQPGGRPHGETEALARAGDARKARPPMSASSLAPSRQDAALRRCADRRRHRARRGARSKIPIRASPGAGSQRLRDAGIAVEIGLCARKRRELNAGFFKRIGEGRPLVTLKLAATLDGRIATSHRRKPMDHRRGGARPRPSAARDA